MSQWEAFGLFCVIIVVWWQLSSRINQLAWQLSSQIDQLVGRLYRIENPPLDGPGTKPTEQAQDRRRT